MSYFQELQKALDKKKGYVVVMKCRYLDGTGLFGNRFSYKTWQEAARKLLDIAHSIPDPDNTLELKGSRFVFDGTLCNIQAFIE